MIDIDDVIRLLEKDPYGFKPDGREYLHHSIGIGIHFPTGFPGKIFVNGVCVGYWEARRLTRALKRRAGVLIDEHIRQICMRELEQALDALE